MVAYKYEYIDELPIKVNELKERGIVGESEVMYKGKRVEIDEKHRTLLMAMDICPLFKRLAQ